MRQIVSALGKRNWVKRAYVVIALCVATAIVSSAQTLTTLVNFNGTDGQEAGIDMPLIQGTNGNLYGTTPIGGSVSPGYGTVFEMNPAGKLTTLYNFCSKQVLPLGIGGAGCTDGAGPTGLVQATDGDFYGATAGGGGASNDTSPGTVFKITPGGKLTTLYSFCSQTNCTDGEYPAAALVQATNGDLYGTTILGGNGNGTVFKITLSGKLTTLYTFCSQTNCTDGGVPNGLVLATDGNFYGTTTEGAPGGTFFKITPAGKLTTLCAAGCGATGKLVQGNDGDFYGTTAQSGTVFKVTPKGKLTTLATVGGYPESGLVLATNGDFYGTTYVGGANNNPSYCQNNGCGSIFKMTPAGVLTTLYNFCSQTNCTDGFWPLGGLMQATNGKLYGTTIAGGAYGYGTVFRLGLGQSAETRPTSGKVGPTVAIAGNNRWTALSTRQ